MGAICGQCEWTHKLVHGLGRKPEGKRPVSNVGVNLVMILC